jgi:16S rRNA (adenine1518-N6/adenine1519-N6)-dimethyltransferase
LGQHFLVAPDIADRIVKAAAVGPEEAVLEIGAGAGALTARLVNIGAHTIAVEQDPRLVEILRHLLPDSKRLDILQADILKVDLRRLLGKGTWKALGNLPYYITGPILGELIAHRRCFSSIVVMLQKEVGERIVSPPGRKEYGGLSVLAQIFFLPRVEMAVKRTCFYPQPEVDSMVLSLAPRPAPLLKEKEEADFERLVRAAFSHRRKTLENSLREAGFVKAREEAAAALEEAGIGKGRRAESLSVEEFILLARRLKPGGRGD